MLIAAVRDNNLIELGKHLSSERNNFDVQSYTCGTPLVAAAFFELPIIVAMQDKKLRALRALIKYKPDFDKDGALGYSARSLLNSGNISAEVRDILKGE